MKGGLICAESPVLMEIQIPEKKKSQLQNLLVAGCALTVYDVEDGVSPLGVIGVEQRDNYMSCVPAGKDMHIVL